MFQVGDRVKVKYSDGTEWEVYSVADASGRVGICIPGQSNGALVPENSLVDASGICPTTYGWHVGDKVCLIGDPSLTVYTTVSAPPPGFSLWELEDNLGNRRMFADCGLIMANCVNPVVKPLFNVGDLVDLIGSPDPAGWWVRASHGNGQYKIEHSVTMAVIDPVSESSMTFNPKSPVVGQMQAKIIAAVHGLATPSSPVGFPLGYKITPIVCEWGAAKCGSKIHSNWCPLA